MGSTHEQYGVYGSRDHTAAGPSIAKGPQARDCYRRGLHMRRTMSGQFAKRKCMMSPSCTR
jgi:hypothetical protein